MPKDMFGVHSCNKRRHAGIRSHSFDRTMPAKTKSWSLWLIHNSGLFARLEACSNFQKHCLQNASAEFLCGIGVHGDCSNDKSGDECGVNT